MGVKNIEKVLIKVVCSIFGEIYLVYIGDINDLVRYFFICWFFNFMLIMISYYNWGRCFVMICVIKLNVKSVSVLFG